MKVLLYSRGEKKFSKSGIGRAMKHQLKALEMSGIEFTTNENDDYDIVHINTIDFNARAMAMKAKKEGKKVVYHAHSTEEDFRDSFVFSNQLSPVFKKHIVNCYNLGDVILTPTPYSKHLLENYNIDKPITAISNGIDLQRFKYDENKVKRFRDYFGLDENDKVVIGVGLYFERKGLPDFMDVAKALPEYKFIWFGHTPLASVTKKIKTAINGKPDNVILPGYISGDIIEGAYASANIFFFPSYEETEGIVVLEALASRCQCVVRDIGVYDPWLINGVNCYKGSTNQEFIELIYGLIEDKIPSTIEKGYEVAYNRRIEKIGEELKTIYTDLYKGEYYDKSL